MTAAMAATAVVMAVVVVTAAVVVATAAVMEAVVVTAVVTAAVMEATAVVMEATAVVAGGAATATVMRDVCLTSASGTLSGSVFSNLVSLSRCVATNIVLPFVGMPLPY